MAFVLPSKIEWHLTKPQTIRQVRVGVYVCVRVRAWGKLNEHPGIATGAAQQLVAAMKMRLKGSELIAAREIGKSGKISASNDIGGAARVSRVLLMRSQ